jgi:hypothetical protein
LFVPNLKKVDLPLHPMEQNSATSAYDDRGQNLRKPYLQRNNDHGMLGPFEELEMA